MSMQAFHEETKAKIAAMPEDEVRSLLVMRTMIGRASSELLQDVVETYDKIMDEARATIKRQRYTIYVQSAIIGALLVYII